MTPDETTCPKFRHVERTQGGGTQPSGCSARDIADFLNNVIDFRRVAELLKIEKNLQCKTQQEIADEIGLTQKQISIKIKEIEEKVIELYQNPEMEISIKYRFLYEKTQKIYQFSPFLYNIWNTSRLDNDQKEHFGNFPVEFMDNLLYYKR